MLALLMIAMLNVFLAGVILWQVHVIIIDLKSLQSALAPYRNLDEVCLRESADRNG